MAAKTSRNCITLKGSANIIVEYLNYSINSILYQRGIYPAETFERTECYNLVLLMSTDPKIIEFLKNVLTQTEEWLQKNMIGKIVLVISSVYSKETLECWDFVMKPDGSNKKDNNRNSIVSTKSLKRIQNEIRDVMRQIAATITYLPLLECTCTFDIMFYTQPECDIPDSWDETSAVYINNPQRVVLHSFSTGIQKVETVVNYKMTT